MPKMLLKGFRKAWDPGGKTCRAQSPVKNLFLDLKCSALNNPESKESFLRTFKSGKIITTFLVIGVYKTLLYQGMEI